MSSSVPNPSLTNRSLRRETMASLARIQKVPCVQPGTRGRLEEFKSKTRLPAVRRSTDLSVTRNRSQNRGPSPIATLAQDHAATRPEVPTRRRNSKIRFFNTFRSRLRNQVRKMNNSWTSTQMARRKASARPPPTSSNQREAGPTPL